VLLAVKNMGGESEAAWQALLDDLVKRGLVPSQFVLELILARSPA
jgi:putative transposase